MTLCRRIPACRSSRALNDCCYACSFRDPSTRYPLLVTTADHALLDPAMIADFAPCNGADLAIGLVEHTNLMARLPTTERTWLRCAWRLFWRQSVRLQYRKGGRCGRAMAVGRAGPKRRRMIAALGPLALLGAAFRLRTLDQTLDQWGAVWTCAASRAGRSVCRGRCDKPADHDLVSAILEGRA